MKFLTLNSHSWMEENAQQKFETLKEQILEAQYDVICFQEVNQEMASETVETDEYYHSRYGCRPKSNSSEALGQPTLQPIREQSDPCE